MGASGISHFAQRGPGETKFPSWAMILTSSVATFLCVAVCVGFVCARMQKKSVEMQRVIGDLRTEVNDLRVVVLTAWARASEADEAVRAELDEIRSRFRR